MPGSEPELDTAVGEAVERRCLLGDGDRMAQVIVEHKRADPDGRRGSGGRGQGDEGTQLGADVIADLEDVKTRRLCFPSGACDRSDIVRG
jgi:hypothetical protein